ncbi:acetylornithine and succinylornithine aminotransferase [Metschnikowia bicuspidata var. bicuspidata NRRL YB-4993]|uniref:Acetylornithine aminotransferase, mitochondrial n=1 Tax=Metschnikowia bicuspidata var. bicuspidata NRRL YB-4993 TaxID=869754 RepID=A0A1A0HBB8_9ASCO|nr:acetylornithine and succinylornithine aminotransferase [Metschnikowia bicuspidata var. bicuspidata NRRL YB-4993]OBA21429.1 acetylornithine and succinylornithine aminotransferase [Metschnikowia bicuspidata var. bicuspidata NRRL YB-4993]
MLRSACLKPARLAAGLQRFSTSRARSGAHVPVADADASSVTGKFIDDITKPYTVTTYARPNVVITRGKGSYLYDLEDRQYVDFTAGIAVTCLGHSNDEVSRIIAKQAQTLMHCSNLYYNAPAGDLANKLVRKTIDAGGMADAQRVFLCNSGAEANEAALKFARRYGKASGEEKTEIICFKNGFHGRTMGALSVTANPKYQMPFAPLVPGVHVADPADIGSVEAVISRARTAAVIIEPIQGEGGVNTVDPQFLVQLRKLCTDNDAVLIYDEIQCGLGRTGQLWAHCALGRDAHPDIVTMAKALGNGFPIGAVLVGDKIENALQVGDHGTTYGGNPLGASVGSYVVDQVSDGDFLGHVAVASKKFTDGLAKIQARHPDKVKAVKGRGLLLGLQLHDHVDAGAIIHKCREYGLLVITAGGNVIRLVPALNIPEDVIEQGMDILAKAVAEV